MKLPKIFVFDLDNCVWYPEMYMIWGGGPPFTYDGKHMYDCKKTKIYLHGYVEQFLKDFANNKYPDSKLAIASRCDEPSWARTCLNTFLINNKPMGELFSYQEIYKGSKQNHLKQIKKQSKVDFDNMVFFDDAGDNIRDVSQLGVISVLTPEGFEKEHLEEALTRFNQ